LAVASRPALAQPALSLVVIVVTLVAAFFAGCDECCSNGHKPVIQCIGDSITFGVTVGSRGTTPWRDDALGGYPGRLQRRLGCRASVLNRGFPGATAALWLTENTHPSWSQLWGASGKFWPDFRDVIPSPGASTLALGVLLHDRPDVVVMLLGINDFLFKGDLSDVEIADVAAQRLDTIHDQASSVAGTVLLATVLPSRRDPEAFRERLNARIRAAHPDYLPLSERFTAAGWETLLADVVHPNEQGYELLAQVLAEELIRRGLVSGCGDDPPARRSDDEDPQPDAAAGLSREAHPKG
jgi:lysophospholipase L1-like esterase